MKEERARKSKMVITTSKKRICEERRLESDKRENGKITSG
jgi:hypothetical protein